MTRSRRSFALALLVGAALAQGVGAEAFAAPGASASPQAAPMLHGPLRTYPPHPLAAEARRARASAGQAAAAPPVRRRTVSTAPLAAPATMLAEPIVSADATTIIVPFQGPAPTFRPFNMSASRHYIDFYESELEGPWVQRSSVTGLLTRLDLAVHPEDRLTRLAFEASAPLSVHVQVVPVAHRIVITLQPTATPVAARSAKPTPSAKPGLASAPAPQAAPAGANPLPPNARTTEPAAPKPGASLAPGAKAAAPLSSPAPGGNGRTTASALAEAVSAAAGKSAPPATPAPEASKAPARPIARVSPVAQATPPAPPAAAPKAAPTWRTRLTGLAYDPLRQALALPFDGDLPAPALQAEGPQRLTLRFSGAAWEDALRSATRAGGADTPFSSFATLSEADGSATLRLELRSPGDVLVAYAPNQRRLYLVPQPRPEKPAALSTTGVVRTVLGRFTFDPKLRALVVPYFGQVPQTAFVPVGPHQGYLEFADSAFDPKGVQLETVSDFPPLDFFWVTPRAQQMGVRLALHLPYGGHAEVVDDAVQHRLVITPKLGPAPAAQP